MKKYLSLFLTGVNHGFLTKPQSLVICAIKDSLSYSANITAEFVAKYSVKTAVTFGYSKSGLTKTITLNGTW